MELRTFIETMIAIHGHAVIGVAASETQTAFSYTVGLTSQHGVELIVFGLPRTIACTILNGIVKRGGPFKLNEPLTEIANLPLVIKQCTSQASDFGIQAEKFYGKHLNFCQVVLPDAEGVFPWQSGYDRELMGVLQVELFQPLS